jgi:hypothetical protein
VTGFAEFIGNMRGGPEDKPDALTRARMATDRPEQPYDDDERQANLLGRGYAPGQATDLAQRYADKRAELAGELEKIEKGEKVTARVRGLLERGQIGGLDAARMMDGDFGDAHRAEQLQRQCENLSKQLEEASAMISPQAERAPDQFAQANRTAQTAHNVFAEVTRQRMAELGTRQARRPERRRAPFAGHGDAVRSELECVHCIAENVDAETSALLHHDPQYDVPVTTAEQLQAARHDREVAR